MSNPIPGSVQEILDLFASELAAVSFPGLESGVLQTLADQTIAAAHALSQAEETVEKARLALTEAQDTLQQKAQRALAYARVYAEDNPTLAERLDAITPLGRPARRTAKVDTTPPPDAAMPTNGLARRGRPRKVDATSLLLNSGEGSNTEQES